MALRAEEDVAIADKTALKIMHEMGISCGIRRESDYHRYNSFKGVVGRAFDNVLDRDFSADEPWQKLGTDVTEFKAPWGRAYFAPAYDFGSKEIVSWSISRSANMAQQKEMLEGLLAKMPEAASPVMHSDMGWQYQHDGYCKTLEEAGIVQSMSRKGKCTSTTARPSRSSAISRTSSSAGRASRASRSSRRGSRRTSSTGTRGEGRLN